VDQLAYAKEYRVVTYDQETKMANLKIFYENEHGVITTIANKVE
jgi:hypothetical protein